MISNTEKSHLIVLEESLWKDETRFDMAYMEDILHPDFFEFGRSGRTYQRQDTLDVPREPTRAKFPLKDLKIDEISDDVVLITYKSQVQYDTLEVWNRSSIWVNLDGKWRLRFHQGTPTTFL